MKKCLMIKKTNKKNIQIMQVAIGMNLLMNRSLITAIGVAVSRPCATMSVYIRSSELSLTINHEGAELYCIYHLPFICTHAII